MAHTVILQLVTMTHSMQFCNIYPGIKKQGKEISQFQLGVFLSNLDPCWLLEQVPVFCYKAFRVCSIILPNLRQGKHLKVCYYRYSEDFNCLWQSLILFIAQQKYDRKAQISHYFLLITGDESDLASSTGGLGTVFSSRK